MPDKKARNPACPSLRRCKQYQDGNDESVKTFRELSIKVSTIVVNETENRLLKSGKDNPDIFLKNFNRDKIPPKPHQATLKRNLTTLKRKVGNA